MYGNLFLSGKHQHWKGDQGALSTTFVLDRVRLKNYKNRWLSQQFLERIVLPIYSTVLPQHSQEFLQKHSYKNYGW